MRAVGRKQRGEIGAKSESKMRAVFVDRFKVKEKKSQKYRNSTNIMFMNGGDCGELKNQSRWQKMM